MSNNEDELRSVLYEGHVSWGNYSDDAVRLAESLIAEDDALTSVELDRRLSCAEQIAAQEKTRQVMPHHVYGAAFTCATPHDDALKAAVDACETMAELYDVDISSIDIIHVQNIRKAAIGLLDSTPQIITQNPNRPNSKSYYKPGITADEAKPHLKAIRKAAEHFRGQTDSD